MSLVVNDLSKKYGTKTVVDHISFTMDKPGVYALLGTNGAGKTTSIRMILGMLSKNSGEVLWNDKPLSVKTCNIGYLAEERGLYPKYTLMDQLIYFAELKGVSKADAKERIAYWAKRLELMEYLYPDAVSEGIVNVKSENNSLFGKRQKKIKPKLADQLSKGNQQKIQLISALISDPELIILDEPLSGLDPVNADLFKSVIREQIAKNKYIIMSSHQMETIEEFCTDLTIMHHSKVVLQGHINDIKKSYGRVNLSLKTEGDVTDLINAEGITILSQNENEYKLKVTGDEQANRLLMAIAKKGISIVTFDLREPSLHEIFVEKVGGDHE